jgi:hypothetical protein
MLICLIEGRKILPPLSLSLFLIFFLGGRTSPPPPSGSATGYAHLFLIEREYFGFNTLECCCWINMKYLTYLNILFEDNHVQWKLQKRGDALRTTLVLKIGLKKFLSINFHQNISHWSIDISRHHCTKFYTPILC